MTRYNPTSNWNWY